MGERDFGSFDGYWVLQMTYISYFVKKSEALRAHFVKIIYLDLCANQRIYRSADCIILRTYSSAIKVEIQVLKSAKFVGRHASDPS